MSSLSLAVCLFRDVTCLDYQGPMELFGFLSQRSLVHLPTQPPYSINATYLSHSLDPVVPMNGPSLLPTRSYADVKDDEQFDIILVPGGWGAMPGEVHPSLITFLQHQAPRAKYILSVCTGSWILAQAGLLSGKRATTNKFSFKAVQDTTSHQAITWVPKARWVVDGNLWTSSGVTAGIDMTNAFIEHLVGATITSHIRGVVELSAHDESDDPFASFYGLVDQ